MPESRHPVIRIIAFGIMFAVGVIIVGIAGLVIALPFAAAKKLGLS